MQHTVLLIIIAAQGAAVGVIAVCGDLDTGSLSAAVILNDHGRVLKYIALKDLLDHIARFGHGQILRHRAHRSR